MSNKKNIGILLAGIGIFLMGVSMLIFVLKGCGSPQQNQEVSNDEIIKNLDDYTKKILEDPKTQEDLKKALSEVEIKSVETRIETIK